MAEEKKTTQPEVAAEPVVAPVAAVEKTPVKTDASARRRPPQGGRGAGGDRRPRRQQEREPREWEQRILDLARVTRVTKGGKRMRFRAALVIGDKKGRVGFGVAKGPDVQVAIQKAFHQAKRNVITLPLVHGSFPHRVEGKFAAAEIILAPAPKGTGLKSGGAPRLIMELGGVSDCVTKILRGSNPANLAKATFDAIQHMIIPEGVKTDTDQAAAERKAKREDSAKKVVKVEKKAPRKVAPKAA
ncbi:30S ribosomal protein S5 [Candidatus Uhrbacteria bacterium CG10_big_fil_rev_8_21_14_0_10_50_16]|uniref:Small ribosomal subunit protein uS5 n=1 Tax=Candidatus Uhrbacteria bacterium CG10_big_fil_rev_8_21_14_0_10_50_16 TaxID=1975039 RepID=A0A2H0RMA3_9BACT|nr:MAG: 30S ribosomal protein S5 [Candidatus Uhrbacteria bacterium CG10_big_fil_rev_8_21_14_0_10_50_16]